jgi:hypothetical protein
MILLPHPPLLPVKNADNDRTVTPSNCDHTAPGRHFCGWHRPSRDRPSKVGSSNGCVNATEREGRVAMAGGMDSASGDLQCGGPDADSIVHMGQWL